MQALSKPVSEGEAVPGDILIASTGAIVSGKTGLDMVPLRVTHEYKEWIPKDSKTGGGGGLIATHAPDSPLVKEAIGRSTQFGKYYTESGNNLVETYTIIAYAVESSMMISLEMTSSKIAAYRKWSNAVRTFMLNGSRPPLFAHLVKLKTERIENSRGTFFNVSLLPAKGTLEESLIDPDSDLYEVVSGIRNDIMKA